MRNPGKNHRYRSSSRVHCGKGRIKAFREGIAGDHLILDTNGRLRAASAKSDRSDGDADGERDAEAAADVAGDR
jgi:hypothetical protein